MMAFIPMFLNWLMGPRWGLYLILGGLGLATVGGAYVAGRIQGAQNCNEATLKTKIALLEEDLKNQKKASALEDKETKTLEDRVAQYAKDLKDRPDVGCKWTAPDIERLRK